ncbi:MULTISPECIES: acyl-CoA dehydrogenase family protein [unclassified Rothia (in: high G+C Gram-positive bacteria)]|uniref:acyl-CoA dehydrogenase family protein n=1 Tax=unclassified Rothia (in: high G+C Gram-positive bacteria) TaxID=2689056 RepID=UPI00195C54C5|nr:MULTISPECIES: acyl-CoA dehydrogenase family protein [unclassified Rothia (in: high G+C Gram-positive bacteria)]MBM7050884.1 acyl-CoA dehydrogenase family protein [Rothia sp. ZJ1223]QRZ62376.1 acyl-CoA dehydrogenase family protein [Rothia sp. ZJ932]
MKTRFYTEDHELFREVAREFVAREVAPNYPQWDQEHMMPRSVWKAAGEAGVLGLAIPEEFGGAEMPDYRFQTVLTEELASAGCFGFALAVHLQQDLVLPYLLAYGTDEQKQQWLPRMVEGALVTSCALTEPGAGSDLRAARTTAVKEGEYYVLNGQKTFIGSGISGDAAIVLARTDGSTGGRGGAESFSLFFVEKTEGYTAGNQLDKMGVRASDTAELFFDNVKVPAKNLIGEEGRGLLYVKEQLPQARLAIAAASAITVRATVEATIEYVKERQAFGSRVADFQNTRFEISDLMTDVEVTELYLAHAIDAFNAGELTAEDAAKVKIFASEKATHVTDRALQLFGGYAYILEHPVAQAFLAARLLTIFGGTNEILRDTVGADLLV